MYILEYTPHVLARDVITGAAKANVRVRIRRGIVQIQRESTRVGSIIPVAATFESGAIENYSLTNYCSINIFYHISFS